MTVDPELFCINYLWHLHFI